MASQALIRIQQQLGQRFETTVNNRRKQARLKEVTAQVIGVYEDGAIAVKALDGSVVKVNRSTSNSFPAIGQKVILSRPGLDADPFLNVEPRG